jgi:uncharacterized lipoprotein YajG
MTHKSLSTPNLTPKTLLLLGALLTLLTGCAGGKKSEEYTPAKGETRQAQEAK